MKKSFLFAFAALLTGAILPSCLGETDSSYEGRGQFAVVDVVGSTPIVRFVLGNSGVIAMSNTGELAGYSAGDALFLDYKLNLNNVTSDGIYIADYLSISDENVYRVNEQKLVQTRVKDLALADGEVMFKTFPLSPIYSSNDFFLDRWAFSYTYSLKEGQSLDTDFYYDPEKQTDNNGEAVPEDTYIIDVRLRLLGTPNNPSAEGKTTEKYVIVNFSYLRSILRPEIIDTNGTVKKLRFRYYKEGDTDGTPTISADAGSLLYTQDNVN